MVECPVFFKKSSILFIEEHAAAFSSKFNVLFEVNPADEIDDGKTDTSDVTIPHGKKMKKRTLYKKTETDIVTNYLRKKLQI